jgi:hypothetical protein
MALTELDRTFDLNNYDFTGKRTFARFDSYKILAAFVWLAGQGSVVLYHSQHGQ